MNYIRDIREGDLEYLSENLRAADKMEVWATTGLDPLDALKASVGVSENTIIIDFSGKPCGIFGTSSINDKTHAIWMVATDELQEHPKKFLRYCKTTLENLFWITGASSFVNLSYHKNTLHHKWLRWCGAEFFEPQPFGTSQEPFLPFEIRRTN